MNSKLSFILFIYLIIVFNLYNYYYRDDFGYVNRAKIYIYKIKTDNEDDIFNNKNIKKRGDYIYKG